MLKKIVLISILFLSQFGISQESTLQAKKYSSLCKIWGFLKYYHPNVAKGKYNWDDQLINKLNEIEKVNSKEELNKIFLTWIDNLGEIKPINLKKNDSTYFEKNFSLSWFKNNQLFENNLTEKLKFIEQNRNQGSQHYIAKERSGLKLTNELEYGQAFPSKEIRIVEFFRFWNLIEYFYPHKYTIKKGWDSILTNYSSRIINCKSQMEYHLLYTEILEKINDSHSNFYSTTLSNFYGTTRTPFFLEYVDNKLIITGFKDRKLINENEIKIGDIILKVDDKTIDEIYKSKAKYMIASNDTYKFYKFIKGGHFVPSSSKSSKLTIERDGKIFDTEIGLFKGNEINPENKVLKEDKTKWKLIQNDIGYVNLKEADKKDINDFYEAFKNTKAVIFDIRNYPNFIGREIVTKFSKSKKTSAIYACSDLEYPGKYILKKQVFGTENNSTPYNGKIIILVNQESISRSEWTAMQLQTLDNSTTIGSQTAGADGESIRFKINGAYTGFTVNGVFYPNGDETQILGVKIDINAKPTLKGFLEGRDEVLERAIEFINTNK